jgi:hypothetical protein
VENEVSGNLEEKVTKEENASSSGEDGIREPGDIVHGQFRKANVDPVDIGQDVTGEENRDESEGNLAVDGRVR